jgi:hypothetical protein
MVAVRMVQVPVHQVIEMVAVWHCLVTASGPMDVARFMAGATMVRRTSNRVCRGYLDHMFIDVVAFDVLQVTILQVVNVTTVTYGRVTAIRTVRVCCWHDLPRCSIVVARR